MCFINREISVFLNKAVCALILIVFFTACSSSQFYQKFKLRYNEIYNVDVQLQEVERNIRVRSLQEFTSLLGQPNPQYYTQLDSIIQNLQSFLAQVEDEKFREELYFRLGKSYFFKSDYYTSLSYFDLMQQKDNNLHLWKARALLYAQKYGATLTFFQDANLYNLSKVQQSLGYAIKADAFFGLHEIDSAKIYLHKAIETKLLNPYKYHWLLQLGKWDAVASPHKSIYYFQKVAQSNSASSANKIEAKIHLARLKFENKERQLSEIAKILRSGYSIGNEWMIHAGMAQVYLENGNIDSAEYHVKVLTEDSVPENIKSLQRWEIAKAHIAQYDFEKARQVIAEIDQTSLFGLDGRSLLLISNYETWLQRLEDMHRVGMVDRGSKTYADVQWKLLSFYKNIGLNQDAIVVLKQMLGNLAIPKFDLIHELNTIDTTLAADFKDYYVEAIRPKKHFEEVYKNLWTDFEAEKYKDVIEKVALYNDDRFGREDNAKLAYLKAFAIGYTQPIDSLILAFELIQQQHQNTFISTLVRQHLNFIEKNRTEFNTRKVALEKPTFLFTSVVVPLSPPEISQKDSVNILVSKPDNQLPESVSYYYVIMLEGTKDNLTPTRYGIGQYLRTRLKKEAYTHEVAYIGDEAQYLKMGTFASLQEAVGFADKILPLLPEIIKVREKKYTTFVIPKTILDTLKSLSDVNDYLEKYIKK